MRKAMIAALLLLVLSVGGVCFAAAGVYGARDRVTLTETVVYGDRAAANGLTVALRTNYDEHLFWDTTCALDAGQTVKTAYSFSASKVREERPATYSGVSLEADPNAGWDFDPESPQPPAGLGRAYWELYRTVAPGEEKSAVVYLKDYMDDYPLFVVLDFPGTQCGVWRWEEAYSGEPEPGTQNYALCKIQDFFRIPVLEDERRHISVGRHKDGNLSSTGSGPEEDHFSMGTYSVLTGDACYFTFDAHSSGGQVVDTGEIPGGYGIYRLPYAQERHDESGQKICGVDADGLEMVYPLDPEIQITSLFTDPEQTRLLLYAVEDGRVVLTVIDRETMDTLQKLEIGDWADGGTLYDEGDFLVAVQSGAEELAVICAGEDGYALDFICGISPDEALDFWSWEPAWAYDGERLAFAVTLEKRIDGWGSVRDTCNFGLGVYEESGLAYYGEYQNSLDTGVEWASSYYCSGRDYDPLSVRWQ